MKRNILLLLLVILSFKLCYGDSQNAHLIIKVENMIKTNDRAFIGQFIDKSLNYKSLGKFYKELDDSLSVHSYSLETRVMFARTGINSLLEKADELRFSNRAMSSKLKKNSCYLMTKIISVVYDKWLNEEMNSRFIIENVIDLMKLKFRVAPQIESDVIENYKDYLLAGQLYLAIDDFASAEQYFMIAQEMTSQIEIQEYVDVVDIYKELSTAVTYLVKDGTTFDIAKFLTSYKSYKEKLMAYDLVLAAKSNNKEVDSLGSHNVPLEETVLFNSRIHALDVKLFSDFSDIKTDTDKDVNGDIDTEEVDND